jgi:hypothetical protein
MASRRIYYAGNAGECTSRFDRAQAWRARDPIVRELRKLCLAKSIVIRAAWQEPVWRGEGL